MASRTATGNTPQPDPKRFCPECNVPLYAVDIAVRSHEELTMWLCLTCPYFTYD
jgi:hypothetical protein